MYDQVLRGQDGSRDVIVDSHGREVGFLGIQHAVPGQDLKLTIDNDLQRAAELALGDRNGAIVAMDPRNGEILAHGVAAQLRSQRCLRSSIDRGEWNKLITDPDHPLMNKAIQAQLAPGSTFKILMSVAGLQEGVAQNLHVNCAGGLGTSTGTTTTATRSMVPSIFTTRFPFSCDTFYYQLGDRLGIDRIAKYATRVWIRAEDGHRSAGRAGGPDAEPALADEELPPRVVSG